MKRLSALALAFSALCASAGELRESPQRIRAEVESFLVREARGLPGETSMEVGAVDARLQLQRCDFLQTFFPAGSRAWGRTTVGVRCPGAKPWTIYVPARVRVKGTYLIAARAIAPGQTLKPEDVVERIGDLTELPAGLIADLSQVSGRIMANRVAAGQPLRIDLMRAEKVVRNGQIVVVVAQGDGFRVTSEGRALGDAAEGHLVHIRTAGGTVVSGIVRPGPVIEVFH